MVAPSVYIRTDTLTLFSLAHRRRPRHRPHSSLASRFRTSHARAKRYKACHIQKLRAAPVRSLIPRTRRLARRPPRTPIYIRHHRVPPSRSTAAPATSRLGKVHTMHRASMPERRSARSQVTRLRHARRFGSGAAGFIIFSRVASACSVLYGSESMRKGPTASGPVARRERMRRVAVGSPPRPPAAWVSTTLTSESTVTTSGAR